MSSFIDSLKNAIKINPSEHINSSGKSSEALKEEQQSIFEKIQDLQSDEDYDSIEQNFLSAQDTQIQQLSEQKAEIDTSISEQQNNINDLNSSINEQNQTINSINQSLSSLVEPNKNDYANVETDKEGNQTVTYPGYKEALAEYENQKSELESQLDEAESTLEDYESQLQNASSTLSDLEMQSQQIEQQINEATEQNDSDNENSAENEENIQKQTEIAQLQSEANALDSEIQQAESAEAQAAAQEENQSDENDKNGVDPISITGEDGTEYDLIVDDGDFDSTSDFLGADDGIEALQKLDADGDGIITGEELADANIKAVVTDENGETQVIDIDELEDALGGELSIDTSTIEGSNEEKSDDGVTVENIFTVSITNEEGEETTLDGKNEIYDDAEALASKYGIEYSEAETENTTGFNNDDDRVEYNDETGEYYVTVESWEDGDSSRNSCMNYIIENSYDWDAIESAYEAAGIEFDKDAAKEALLSSMVDANGIEDPNLIYDGQTIVLSDPYETLGIPKPEEPSETVGVGSDEEVGSEEEEPSETVGVGSDEEVGSEEEELSETVGENEFECTDGCDDGKLSFGETVGCLFKGAAEKVKEQVSNFVETAKEHPLKTAAITVGAVAATAAAVTAFGGAALIGIGAVGVVTGVVKGIKDVCNIFKAGREAKNATTDAEAKEAFYDIGGSAVEVAEDAAQVAMSVATVGTGVKAVKAAQSGTAIAEATSSTIDDSAEEAAKAASSGAAEGAASSAAEGATSSAAKGATSSAAEGAASSAAEGATSSAAKGATKAAASATDEEAAKEAIKSAEEVLKSLKNGVGSKKDILKAIKSVHPDNWEGKAISEEMYKLLVELTKALNNARSAAAA